MIHTPKFWREGGILAYLLLPFSLLYYIIYKIRFFLQTPYRSSARVICVGGIMVGGSGKTPVAIKLAKLYKGNVFFVTRGYGAQVNDPILVNENHTSLQVGDEALLLARHAKTIVCKNRVKAIKMAEMLGADVIITDDGLQNNSFYKDLSLVVMNESLVKNKHIFPAGPYREPLKSALARGAIAIYYGVDIKVNYEKLDNSKSYIAFAGLAYNDKFFNILKEENLKFETISFPDHYQYKKEEIEKLIKKSNLESKVLITTEKDLVRINKELQNKIKFLEINIDFVNEKLYKYFKFD